MLTTKQYMRLLADAYYAAAITNVSMREVVEALEAIRIVINEKNDYFKIWNMLDLQIGKAEGEQLQQILIKLRERFKRRVCESEIARLRKEFKDDAAKGWRAWLKTYGKTYANSSLTLCQALSGADLPFPQQYMAQIADFRRAENYIEQNRFLEAYDSYIYLSQQDELENVERAKILVYAAEVQLLYVSRLEEAKALLQQAGELAPKECTVKIGWGLYQLQQSDFERARDTLQSAIQLDPQVVDSYLILGDSYEQQNNLDAAEQWYREGVRADSGNSSSYMRLVRLYGRTEWFETHKHQLPGLLESANRIYPPGTYNNFLDMGLVYQRNQDYEQAHTWYQKGIDLNHTYVNGYIFMGNAALEQKKYEEAGEAFNKAIKVAPEIFDGYWYMGWLHEQQEHWNEALSWYQQSRPYRKDLEGTIRGKIGDMYLRLEQYTKAEEELCAALRLDNDNQSIVDSLEKLAAQYYKQQGELQAALQLYQNIRQIKGQPYEGTYENLVGNAYYYFENYAEARNAYMKAIEANAGNAVFYSNLSLAWENIHLAGNRLSELESAIAALRQALKLNPAEATYRERLDDLESQQKFIQQFGEAALELSLLLYILEVNVAPDLAPYLTDETDPTGGKINPHLEELADSLRDLLLRELGVKIPTIYFGYRANAPDETYDITMSAVPLYIDQLPQGKRFSPNSPEELAALAIKTQEGINPLTETAGCWVDEADWLKVEEQGLALWQVMEYPLKRLESYLRLNFVELIDQQQVMWLLDYANTPAAEAIKQSTQKRSDLLHVLKGLAQEGVALTALNVICETFNRCKEEGKNLPAIVESVRSAPEIRSALPGNNETFSFYQLGEGLESELAGLLYEEKIINQDHTPLLLLEWEERLDLLRVLWDTVSNQQHIALLVANAQLRPFVRKLVEEYFAWIPTLSVEELLPGLESKVVGKIELSMVDTLQVEAGTAHGTN